MLVYNYKNNDEKYEVIKSIVNKISDFLSNKKTFLKMKAPHHQEGDNSSNLLDVSRQVILPPPPYDEYIIDGCKAIMLEEAEKLYNVLVDQLVCEVINETVGKQPTEDIASLPALPFEKGEVDDDKQTKHKDQKDQQELSDDEKYQTDQQYEQERFTDEYTEYFEDDENKHDRFTDTYGEDFTD